MARNKFECNLGMEIRERKRQGEMVVARAKEIANGPDVSIYGVDARNGRVKRLTKDGISTVGT
ncbi:MAG TPA: hypothetical protein VEM15_08845 [Thermodesulfobacteriota bacterium]|nr:hypothetical protein [Thermodesulfobacteriota bacterium]